MDSAKIPTDWNNIPKVSTRTELLEIRKKNRIPDISFESEKIAKNKDRFLRKNLDKERDCSVNTRSHKTVEKPGKLMINKDFSESKYRAVFPDLNTSQVRSKSELECRRREEIKAKGKHYEKVLNKNLISEVVDPYAKARPSHMLADYRENPNYKSRGEMITIKKHKLLEDLASSYNYNHKSPFERIVLREKIINSPGRAVTPLHDKIRLQNMNHFSDTYSKQPIGLHGAELPKFLEKLKKNWAKNRAGSSSKDLDFLSSNEVSCEKPRFFLKKKTEKFEKPNEVEFFRSEVSREFNRNSRWTGYHYNFIKKTEQDSEIVPSISTTPDVLVKASKVKTPKGFIVERMLGRGSASPLKNQFRSTGFIH